jgi:hypothetical protein
LRRLWPQPKKWMGCCTIRDRTEMRRHMNENKKRLRGRCQIRMREGQCGRRTALGDENYDCIDYCLSVRLANAKIKYPPRGSGDPLTLAILNRDRESLASEQQCLFYPQSSQTFCKSSSKATPVGALNAGKQNINCCIRVDAAEQGEKKEEKCNNNGGRPTTCSRPSR